MTRIGSLIAALLLALAGAATAQTAATGGKVEVVWLGQSVFKITSPGGKVIVIDPWLRTNPLTPPEYKQLDKFGKVDVLLVSRNPVSDKDETHVGGEPVGWIIELENGFRIYHAGDTAVFGDMRLIGELYRPHIALLPIGGHFTMGPREAALAVE